MASTAALQPTFPQLSAPLQGRWLAIAMLALLALQVKGWWIPGPDASAYLSISRNLAQGKLESLGSPHLHHAPGYPALIAPTWWFSDTPFWLISFIHFTLAAALGGGVYLWAQRFQPVLSTFIAALVLANAGLWEAFRMTHSELAFMTELVWCAVCLERATTAHGWRNTLVWLIPGIALGIAAGCTRQVGALLVAGFVTRQICSAWQRQQPRLRAVAMSLAVAVPVFAAVGAMVVWDHHRAALLGPAAKSYGEYFFDESLTPVQQASEGLRLRIAECGRLLLPGMIKSYARAGEWLNINSIVYLAFLPIPLIGWFRLVRRGPDTLLLTAPFYTALYVAWPFDQGTRYMLPMLPVLWAAVTELCERLPRAAPTLTGLVGLHAGAALVYWIYTLVGCTYAADWKQLEPLAEKVAASGEPAALWKMDEKRAHIVRLQLDQRVPCAEDSPERAGWLLSPADAEAPPGFKLRLAGERFALWQREIQEAVGSRAASQASSIRGSRLQ